MTSTGWIKPTEDTTWPVRREIPTATGQAHTWSGRTEVVWSNRPFPQGQLFDLDESA